jgi:hypothetical protein
MEKQDTVVPLSVHPFCPKEKTVLRYSFKSNSALATAET